MFLERLQKHISAKNWLIIVIEFLVLVLGFFLSLQINDWENEQNNLRLEQEYLIRLHDDFRQSQIIVNEDIQRLTTHNADIGVGLEILRKKQPIVSTEEQASFLKALQAVASIGRFGVLLGTLEELKDTGNMRLIRSQELRKALGNLNQKYQQILRSTDLRNGLREYAFPIIIKYLVEDGNQQMILNNELKTEHYRELYSSLKIIQTNQIFDRKDSEALLEQIDNILSIIEGQIMHNT